MSSSRRLKKILNPECDLYRNLVARAQRMQQLTRLAREVVPGPEGGHISAVAIVETGAVVWTDSAAWATRLRYQADALLERLRQVDTLGGLKSVQVKVLPNNDAPREKTRPKPTLTAQSAQTVAACAAYVSDAKLKEALERLARNAGGSFVDEPRD
jgi:hypothetical protein